MDRDQPVIEIELLVEVFQLAFRLELPGLVPELRMQCLRSGSRSAGSNTSGTIT